MSPVRIRVVPPLAAALVAIAFGCGGTEAADRTPAVQVPVTTEFDGAKAMAYVNTQLAFGPRVPGTAAHRAMGDWLVTELRKRADTVIVQTWTHTTADGRRLPMRNVLARFAPTASHRVLYLAHWDSRPGSEKATDPAQRTLPVPGANDGASGVAILLGVADALKERPAAVGVDLPSAGYMPVFGVLFDMVGHVGARFQYESHSLRAAPEVVQRVWGTAARLGHAASFPNREYGAITDDHVPLIEVGMKVIDLIDLNYAWHHTPEDTADKLALATLQMVGDVAITVLRDLR
jgi:glutaminyl-peptide cyclotransferase